MQARIVPHAVSSDSSKSVVLGWARPGYRTDSEQWLGVSNNSWGIDLGCRDKLHDGSRSDFGMYAEINMPVAIVLRLEANEIGMFMFINDQWFGPAFADFDIGNGFSPAASMRSDAACVLSFDARKMSLFKRVLERFPDAKPFAFQADARLFPQPWFEQPDATAAWAIGRRSLSAADAASTEAELVSAHRGDEETFRLRKIQPGQYNCEGYQGERSAKCNVAVTQGTFYFEVQMTLHSQDSSPTKGITVRVFRLR